MSDAQRYAVWPDPRSMSRTRALVSWKFFHFQKLYPLPFAVGAGNWPLVQTFLNYATISKFDDRARFLIFVLVSVTWVWTWQKWQLQRVDRQSPYGANFFLLFSRPGELLKRGQILESPWISYFKSFKFRPTWQQWATAENSTTAVQLRYNYKCLRMCRLVKVNMLKCLIFLTLYK